MTSPTNVPDRSAGKQLRRYGPFAVVLVIVIVIVIVAITSGNGGDDDETATQDGGNGSSEIGAPDPIGEMPITYDEAVEEGTEDDYDWGDRCDTETGQLKMPTVYAPPCVPVFEGDNGGATSTGVTADTIKIVRYQAQQGADLQSLLAGANVNIDPNDSKETAGQYVEVFSALAETYGREIELITYDGTGESNDEVVSRADAIEIAEDIAPFAVISGPALDGGAFAEELANRGIICMDCSQAMPDRVIQENQPYIWGGATPSVNQMLENLFAWTAAAQEQADTDDVAGDLAQFAGDPELQEQERKVGVVHFEQDPPVFDETAEANQSTLDQNVELRESYLFSLANLASLPEQAKELIAKMKSAGVNSIVFIGDPIMPIYLTQEATSQDYYPEWIIPGVALTDTTQLSRQYDPEQWDSAYGISHLGARIPREQGGFWTIYEWYFGEGSAPPPSESTFAIIGAQYARLLLGIQMAGPDLTPETFQLGLFRVPPAGGGPTAPQVSYGNWGFFAEPDYNGIDDAVPIWWDGEIEGPDENDNIAVGMWRYANGGERFVSNAPIAPNPFVDEDSVTIFDAPPADFRPPDYPPPPGSPAAG